MPRTAPATLHCRTVLFGMKACEWRCAVPPRGAKFVNRLSPGRMAILHPSSKRAGWWQVSRFMDGHPVGDALRPTCDAALKDGLDAPRTWRLAKKGE